MLASDVLDRVSRDDLNDSGRVRWTSEMLLRYLTDAMRQTVLLRPDALSTVATVKLTAGNTRQQIPSGSVRFLSLVRNMGSDGGTPGFPISPTTREAMDASSASWHTDAPSAIIDHYLYNADTPTFFYVSPPPAANVYVEMEYAQDVSDLTSLGDTLPLSSVWMEPLREYVLYRAFAINGASAVDGPRAQQHLGQFYLALGEESKAKALFNPYVPTAAK